MSLDTNYVLVLNSGWVPIGVKRLKEAITAVYDNSEWQLLHIEKIQEELSIHPVSWEEWLQLDASDQSNHIKTLRGNIKIPTVIISKNYSKVHFRKFKPNKTGIYVRDKGTCQYTGKKLTKTNCSIDHLIPKSRGGTNTWDNMVLCDKTINNKKGSKLPEEFNIKVKNKPKEPPVVPAAQLITTRHSDWEYFINYQSLHA